MESEDLLPVRLYKYQSFTTQSLANLKNRTIWFSQPTSFNDPFDCSISLLTQPNADNLSQIVKIYSDRIPSSEKERYLDENGQPTVEFVESIQNGLRNGFMERKQLMLNERGVSCFAERNDNLLMWSHYGDGHRGFCLEFDTKFEPFASNSHRVIYSTEVPEIDPAKALLDTSHNMMQSLIVTKSSEWEYEREWRLLHMEANKLYTYDWKSLTGIYLGCCMPDENAELLCMILRDSPTKLYRMRRSEDQFQILSEEIQYQPFVYGSNSDSQS